MQTLTLCESVFGAPSQPLSPNQLNSPTSSSSFLLPKKKKWKLSSRNSPFSLSRCSRPWSQFVTEDEVFLWHSDESLSASMRGIVSFHDDGNGEETPRSTDHDCNHLNMPPAEISTMQKLSMSLNQDAAPVFDALRHKGLKLRLFIGLLISQGSQQAVASSDFASGMQSIPYIGDLGDISTGFASAFLLIFFSELGDKTFFIAALLAARNSGLVVFLGTFGALAAMTIVSVIIGRTFHYVDDILPFRFGGTDLPIDDIAAVFLLVYFGVSSLLEASSGDGLRAEEEQKEAELAVSDISGNGAGILAAANTVISTFALVFVAEWGDKSFFSTIALAAASSPLGVVGGALAGHAVATVLAVVGGSLLGTFFSEKVIAYTGGVLFLVFAVVTLIEILN